ncbi:MAG: AsmA-like C-terminal region-containing protein [Myxococcota bacterium]
MLRRIIQVAAVFLLLVFLVLGALATVLPRYVETDEFQAGLRARATAALGTEVSWDHVEVGVLPPRVILDSLVVGSVAGGGADARVSASAVDLRFSLWPLLSRRLEMGSLMIRGLDLVVTRTDAGWVLPFGVAGEEGAVGETGSDPAAEGDASGGALDSGATAGGALALTLGRIQLSDAVIRLRDRALDREADWELSSFGFDAVEAAESGRYALTYDGDLVAGPTSMGPVDGEGELRLGGLGAGAIDLGFDLEVELDGAQIEPLVSYLPVRSGSGSLSGRLELEGEAGEVREIRADLRAANLSTQLAGIDVNGEMALQAVQRPGAASDFDVAIDFESGGRAELAGTRGVDSSISGKGRLDAVDSAAFASLFGEGRAVSGAISGDVAFATGGDGGIAAFDTDLVVSPFAYSDGTHQLSEGDLKVDLAFAQDGTGAGSFSLDGGFDGTARLPQTGARTLGGVVKAKLELDKADVAALPFDLSFEALPAGSLTGAIDVRGALSSRFSGAAGSGAGAGGGAKGESPIVLAGKLSLAARTGSAGPFDVDAAATLTEGGGMSAKGTVTRAGALNLVTQMKALDLALLAPFLSTDELRVAGQMSGPGRVAGPMSDPTRFDLDAEVANGELAMGEYEVLGPFGVKLGVDQPLSPRRAGAADLSLTNARVRYEGRFEKKAGIPAQLDTKFKPNAAGETEFESRLKLKNLDRIQIQGALGEASRMTLSASEIDLGEAAEFVPLLAAYGAAGKAALSDLAVEQSGAGRSLIRGKIALREVGLSIPDAGRVQLSGAVLGEGDRLRTEALQVVAGDVTIELEGYLEDPLGASRYAFSGRTVGKPEVNSLLSALTSKTDTVFGPLQFEGDLSGTIPEVGSFRDSMIGTLRFSVGEDVGGRIKGVSLLKAVLDQVPVLGGALLSKPFRGGRSVEDFFSDEFELMSGEFAVQDGALTAKTLRLAYQGYEASLTGSMQLADLSLDMTGDLLLNSDLVAVLVGAMGGDGTDRQPIEIPLARVSNTLSDPKVAMTSRTLVALPRLLLQATGLDRIREGLQEGLGKILNPSLPGIGGSE